ncbi:MAG TPA: class I poly(R)-hydroxyalkanoic acid synthase [Paracoccaceae bacterium]|nr:class I poly(R)-hydroxyalkanoic acid synthase [Paracoccaceae bacterium]
MADQTPETDRAEALAERIGRMIRRSNRLWAEALDRQVDTAVRGKRLKPDPLNAVPAFGKVWKDWWDHPDKAMEAATRYWAGQGELWARATRRALGEAVEPLVEPDRGDRRWKDEQWRESPYFDFLKQSYLLTGHWLKEQMDSAEGLDDRERKKVALLTRNFVEAVSPSNYPGTNPEVIRTTLAEEGENLARGLDNLMRDLERGKGALLIQQSDPTAFRVGENMAVTPGKVVHQNEVMQLIQYAPSTDEVHATPVLIVPPWINKFYILDLNEQKSLIRWMVGQGHTVFVVSWVNPGDAQRDESWESYMKKGALVALDRVLEETGERQANLVGYCIGGTLLATMLAWMAAKGDDRVRSATFFTSQADFSDAGELQAFVDGEVIDTIAQASEEHGFLAAENMFGAFNCLRANDLIWSFVVNNYLLGKDNFPFDLLYWNSDSTRMPGRVHTFYLDTFYNRNLLAKGELVLDGERLDLGRVELPIYHVGTIEDHIAPSPSAYRAARLFGSRSQTFVLAGSGHIAGVVNPPSLGKYQYWTRRGVAQPDLDSWREGAKETAGSWWPHWDRWLARRSGRKVAARQPGAVLGVIEDAPGAYVRELSYAP